MKIKFYDETKAFSYLQDFDRFYSKKQMSPIVASHPEHTLARSVFILSFSTLFLLYCSKFVTALLNSLGSDFGFIQVELKSDLACCIWICG